MVTPDSDSPVIAWKRRMYATVARLGIGEAAWANPDWIPLAATVTQEILDDAALALTDSFYDEGGAYRDLGPVTVQRRTKTVQSTAQQMQGQVPGQENYFRAVSDFHKMTIHCRVDAIAGEVVKLQERAAAHNGYSYVRGSSPATPNGRFQNEQGQYTDIVQFVYLYFPELGYPARFQVGHDFATRAFEADAQLCRARSGDAPPNPDLVDLWQGDFYGHVREAILATANGVAPPPRDLLAEARALYATTERGMPGGLEAMLERMATDEAGGDE